MWLTVFKVLLIAWLVVVLAGHSPSGHPANHDATAEVTALHADRESWKPDAPIGYVAQHAN